MPSSINTRAWELRSRDSARAMELAGEALANARERDDVRAVVSALRTLAVVSLIAAEYADSIRYADEALGLLEESSDKDIDAEIDRAWLHSTLGGALRRTGEGKKAWEHYEAALEIATRIDNPQLRSTALNGLGYMERSAGDYEAALGRHGDAAQLAHQAGEPEEESTALLGVGNTCERLGRYDEALGHYEAALKIADAIEHPRLRAYASGNIGLIHQRHGDHARALEYEQRSLHYKRQANDRWGIGVSLNNIAIIYRHLGQYAAALQAQVQSLDTAREIGDLEGESVALNGIGQIYETLGDRTHLLHYFNSSLMISRQIGYQQGQAYSLLHIGRYYGGLGDHPRALLYMLASHRMFVKSGDRYGERGTVVDIGHVHLRLGGFDRSRQCYQTGLEIALEIGDRIGEVDTRLALGGVEISAGRHHAAIEQLEQGLEVASEIGMLDELRGMYRRLAQAYDALGNQKAVSRYRRRERQCMQQIFDEEHARRVRQIMLEFEENHLKRQAQEMGLDDSDMREVEAAAHVAFKRRRELLLPDDSDDLLPPGAGDDAGLSAGNRSGGHGDEIQVTTLGEFHVSIDGRRLQASDWQRKRARDLFKLLLVNHRRAITIDEIAQMLWGDEAHKRNIEALVMNAVSHIRRALEPDRERGAPSAYLAMNDGAYVLDLGEGASVDFLKFKELVVAARRSGSPEERLRLYEAAVELYHGDFLKEDYYESWPATEREMLKDAWLEAQEFLAAEYLRNGAHDEAISAARTILEADTTSQRACDILMRALTARGRHKEARQVRERFEEEGRR